MDGQKYTFGVYDYAEEYELDIFLTDDDVESIVRAMVDNGNPGTFTLSDLEFSPVLSDDTAFRKICRKVGSFLHIQMDFSDDSYDVDTDMFQLDFPYEIVAIAEEVISEQAEGKIRDIVSAGIALGIAYWLMKN